MGQVNRKTLNITLLITIITIISVVTISIIITNVIYNDWRFFEISTAIGTTLMIIGGIGIYSSYAGGYAISSPRLHAQAPEIAITEMEYARKRRATMPILSFIIFGLGIIFLAIGLSGVV